MIKKTFLPDLVITIPIIFLLFLGILVIYSSDPKLAFQQAVFALIGLIIYWMFSHIDFETLTNITNILYILVLVLLIIVLILGVETRGSVRWMNILGFGFQPSEFAKPVIILFLAKFWSKNSSSWKNIFKSLLLISPILILIYRQPDLGTALTMLAIWMMMVIGANISLLKLFIMGAVSLITIPISWFFLKDYQKNRIESFLSPERDPLGIGYNVIQSTIAVGSGQFLGRGLGRGTQSRLQFLPEFRTDFIFSSIAEEFGFIGSMLVLSLYGIIITRLLIILSQMRVRFHSLLVFGVLGMLFFQTAVNISMNIGIAPVTGITLPLLSYGGSSILTTLICLGFVCSANRFGKKVELQL